MLPVLIIDSRFVVSVDVPLANPATTNTWTTSWSNHNFFIKRHKKLASS
jgi:hypothetical protein